ncbi:unnamed protein product, partial [Gulo gulo]
MLVIIFKDNEFRNFNILFQRPKPNLEARNCCSISFFNNKRT